MTRDDRLAVDAFEQIEVFVGTREEFYIFFFLPFQYPLPPYINTRTLLPSLIRPNVLFLPFLL